MSHDQDRDPSAAARAYAEGVVRASGTSFYWAMRVLPDDKRQAMYAVYAFCREVDDIADEAGDAVFKRTALDSWREEIERLYAGTPQRPVTVALRDPVARYGLEKQDFLAIIDGMQMDAQARIRIADTAELALYCDRVACAVGRLSVRIFGVPQPQGDRLAEALGNALQLTNILRDIKEDAQRDRLYLPGDLLRRYGISGEGPATHALRHPAVALACEQIARMADRRFGEAALLLRACDRRQVRPAVIMMEVYRRTFRRLTGRGWSRWAEPVSVPPVEKLWVAVRYGVM